MKKIDQKKVLDYWEKTAEHDYETMQVLFKSKRYDASLFFGHLVLEKILKALVVHNTGEHAPRTHHLPRLAEIAGLHLDKEDVTILREANDFNTDARYPEQKLEFYKRCTKEYTSKHFTAIDILYKKLCQKLKQKK